MRGGGACPPGGCCVVGQLRRRQRRGRRHRRTKPVPAAARRLPRAPAAARAGIRRRLSSSWNFSSAINAARWTKASTAASSAISSGRKCSSTTAGLKIHRRQHRRAGLPRLSTLRSTTSPRRPERGDARGKIAEPLVGVATLARRAALQQFLTVTEQFVEFHGVQWCPPWSRLGPPLFFLRAADESLVAATGCPGRTPSVSRPNSEQDYRSPESPVSQVEFLGARLGKTQVGHIAGVASRCGWSDKMRAMKFLPLLCLALVNLAICRRTRTAAEDRQIPARPGRR